MAENIKSTRMIYAAELFYEQRKSQAEVAEILNCSRATASRLISKAIETGIVKIIIKRPVEKFPLLSKEINKYFPLKEVIVVSSGSSEEQAYQNVGYATAELLSRIIHSDIIIGISWGVTLSYMVQKLSEFSFNSKGIEVVQLMGGLSSRDPDIDGPELARKMAESLNGKYYYIQAPAVLETPEIARNLLNEINIKDVIDRANRSEIVITSVGSLEDDLSSIVRSGFIKKNELKIYSNIGAVGHSLAKLIDENGNQINHTYNQRVVAVNFDVLKKAKWSIGLVASSLKAKVTLAALKGNLFNALVIDENTAKAILNLI